jgi:hypothetical protein
MQTAMAVPAGPFKSFQGRWSDVALDNADWQRLGTYVTRRRDELGMTQSEVQAAGGPSTATQRLIEGAARTTYRGAILASLERALRWAPGSVELILTGEEPKPAEGQRASQAPAPHFDAMADWLRSVASDPNKSPALRAWAEAQLDQLAKLHAASRAEDEAGGELAS